MQYLWFNEEIAVIFNNYHVNPSFKTHDLHFIIPKVAGKKKKTTKLEESTGIKIEKGKL